MYLLTLNCSMDDIPLAVACSKAAALGYLEQITPDVLEAAKATHGCDSHPICFSLTQFVDGVPTGDREIIEHPYAEHGYAICDECSARRILGQCGK